MREIFMAGEETPIDESQEQKGGIAEVRGICASKEFNLKQQFVDMVIPNHYKTCGNA